MIAWDKKTTEDATAAGRRPESVPNGLMVDSLVEIKPTGKTTGQVVWEWHLWDHLIQDHDKTKTNYGTVSAHPELVDVNFGQDVVGAIAATPDGANNLRSIGYVGNTPNPPNGRGPGGPGRGNPDWTHINSVAYNADLDQIVVSVHNFSEIWIIDHSTTTAEAASHKGGTSGKGGDLLYRWGNPRAYRAGTNVDQRLFAQHNASWIPKGAERGRASAGVQQRRPPARRHLLVGRRNRAAGRFARSLHAANRVWRSGPINRSGVMSRRTNPISSRC